jgi:hypothetical protein
MRRRWASVLTAGALFGLVAATPKPQGTPAPESFSEAVVVREADVLTEPPPLVGYEDDAESWLVLEDGLEREVVRVEELDAADAEPWDIVVWLDEALASPAVRLHAGAALSRSAAALAARGPVALWSEGRELAVRSEAGGIESFIADAVATAASRSRAELDLELDLGSLDGALDRLLLLADQRPRSGPGLLLVPAAPLPVPPDTADATHRRLLDRLESVAAVLSGYGWTVIVLPFRTPSDEWEQSVDQRDDYERWRDDVATGGIGWDFGVPYPRRRKPISVERTATQVDPALIQWRRFVGPGGGWVVDAEEQLRRALEALSRRRRLWYRTSAPLDGSLRRVETRWRPTGQATRAQLWRRAGTPETVTEARVRDLAARRRLADSAAGALDQRAGRQGLPAPWWRLGDLRPIGGFELEVGAAPGALVRLRVRGTVPEAPAADRRARLTCVRRTAGAGVAMSHRLLPWTAAWEIECPDAIAVSVEDLATGAFGWSWL